MLCSTTAGVPLIVVVAFFYKAVGAPHLRGMGSLEKVQSNDSFVATNTLIPLGRTL